MTALLGGVACGSNGEQSTPQLSPLTLSAGVNSRGETFGSGDVANDAQLPDLIAVIATNRREGFVRKSDYLAGRNLTRDQVLALPTQVVDGKTVYTQPHRMVPVYESDGSTVIGQFELGG